MNLSISSFNNYQNFSFKANSKKSANAHKDPNENPISRKGEVANSVKATFLGGLVVAGKLFWELIVDGDFEFENVAKKAGEIVDKNKEHISKNRRYLYKIGAFVSLIAAGFAGFALLYTAYKAPNIAYQSKVNTFTKSKEMDVYTKANEAEKELYTQLAEKAQVADSEEKEGLKEQYAKMVLAKNKVPDFVKIKQ